MFLAELVWHGLTGFLLGSFWLKTMISSNFLWVPSLQSIVISFVVPAHPLAAWRELAVHGFTDPGANTIRAHQEVVFQDLFLGNCQKVLPNLQTFRGFCGICEGNLREFEGETGVVETLSCLLGCPCCSEIHLILFDTNNASHSASLVMIGSETRCAVPWTNTTMENPMRQMLYFTKHTDFIWFPAMPVVSGNGLTNLPIWKNAGKPQICLQKQRVHVGLSLDQSFGVPSPFKQWWIN